MRRTVTASFVLFLCFCKGAEAPATFTVALTVTGSGRVTSTPAGIDCTSSGGAACSAKFAAGSGVTLGATAGNGAFFSAWGGDCAGTAGICALTLTADRTASAAFVAGASLSVALDGPGSVTSSVGGISCGSACGALLPPGTQVTLTATPGANAEFVSWTGCASSTASCTLTLGGTTTVTAHFVATHTLSVTLAGADSGTVHSTASGYPDINCSTGTCAQTLRHGTAVSLSASPGATAVFGGFSGDCSDLTCSLTMNGDASVTATFSPAVTYVVHTTAADFAAGNWSGYGSVVTAEGGGAVMLQRGGAELLPGGKSPGLTSTQYAAAGAVWNGRFYVAGGFPASGPPIDTVRSAAFNADGTLSAWRDELSMPETMRDQEMVGWNGRLYIGGGYSAGASNHVYSAAVNADGTLVSWDAETPLPTARNGVAFTAWGTRLYAVSGSLNAVNIDGVVTSAEIKPDGHLGSTWRSETTLPGGTAWHAPAYNGRIYGLGGFVDAGDTAVIYSVDIGADGVLGTWRTETPFPVARADAGIAVWGGRIYAAGGRVNAVASGQILSAGINADGTLTAWRMESVAVPSGLSWLQAGAWTGTLALVGSDPAGSVYTFPVNAGGKLGPSWTETKLPAARHGHDTFAFGGNLFAAGGFSGTVDNGGIGTAVSTASAAPLAADGSVGSWADTTNPWFTSAGNRAPAAVVNGHVYAFSNSAGPPNQLFGYASLTAAGLGASWTSSAWPFGSTWIDSNDVVSVGLRLYVAGGEDYGCGVHAQVYQAALADDGSVGSWTATSSMPGGRYMGGGTAWNGYVYHLGGRTTGCPNPPGVPLSTNVFYAKVNDDGTLGAWVTATSSLPAGVQKPGGVEAWDGNLYLLGGTGGDEVSSATVYAAPIQDDGSLGAWAQSASLPGARMAGYGNKFTAKWNGQLYFVGGFLSAGGTDTVWSSGAPRYPARGSYFNAMDFGADKTLLGVSWSASTAGLAAVWISTASSAGAFSDWTQAASGATLSVAGVRHLRYRLDLAPDGTGAAPVLYDLTAAVGP